jgi:hypothetical protein
MARKPHERPNVATTRAEAGEESVPEAVQHERLNLGIGEGCLVLFFRGAVIDVPGFRWSGPHPTDCGFAAFPIGPRAWRVRGASWECGGGLPVTCLSQQEGCRGAFRQRAKNFLPLHSVQFIGSASAVDEHRKNLFEKIRALFEVRGFPLSVMTRSRRASPVSN